MFITAAGTPIAYTDPWRASLEDRLAALVAGHRRMAYFYETPDAHTFRYRVFNMVQALAARPDLRLSAAWFTREDLDRTSDFVDRADLLIICRTRYDSRVGRLVARAKARGLTVLYDIDDLIFDLRHAHLVGDTIGRNLVSSDEWDWWVGYIGRLGMTLGLCDGAIATNAYLAERIGDFAPQLQVKVISNFLNRQQLDVSRNIYRRKRDSKFRRDDHVHIGYFSGTKTHNKDFAVVSGALLDILSRHNEVVLTIVGSLDLPQCLSKYTRRVRKVSLQDFVNLQRYQGEVEIAVAPMQDNAFTNCKSELKYFEAAIAGTVVVASPIFAFRHAIADGETGLLARSHEWAGKLELVLAMLREDGSDYRAMADRAREHAERRYGWASQAETIAAQLFPTP